MSAHSYTVEAYSIAGNKVTFAMHNAGNFNSEDIKAAAEAKLRSYGIPERLCKVYQVKAR